MVHSFKKICVCVLRNRIFNYHYTNRPKTDKIGFSVQFIMKSSYTISQKNTKKKIMKNAAVNFEITVSAQQQQLHFKDFRIYDPPPQVKFRHLCGWEGG